METKLIIALLIAINCYSSCGAQLRRTPKIYNALITTDENLTSSRAFPVIQPTIHETGYAHYPYGPYNPYSGLYGNPLVRFGQPISPHLAQRGQLPYPLPHHPQFPPQYLGQPPHAQPQPFPGYPHAQIPPTAPAEQQPQEPAPAPPSEAPNEQQPIKPPASVPKAQAPNFMLPLAANTPQQMPNEKLPIPLNQFGLPPALIPLSQYSPHHNRNPVNLPPYSYNQYPLIYDPISGFREQFLPPYEYIPSNAFAAGRPTPPKTQPTLAPTPGTEATTLINEDPTEGEPIETFTETPDAPAFESIRNGSKSDVPDVPPPPIPSGAKSKQS